MKEFIEKLISRLEEKEDETVLKAPNTSDISNTEYQKWMMKSYGFKESIEIVNQLAEEMNLSENLTSSDGWIPCSERLPEVEKTVLIFAKRKYKDGSFRNIITTAMYEDGTVLENDSNWGWEDLDAEWDEEEDCYIIPEGWWEDKECNPDGELNHSVDDVVLAWQPLPEPYKKGSETDE